MKTCVLILCLLGSVLLHAQDQQPLLTVAQMQSDLTILKSAFTQLHPGVFRYVSPAQFNEYFEDMAKQTDQPISLTSFYIKLSQLTTKLKCGHTYLNPYNQKKALTSVLFSPQVMPILFSVINKRFIVTHNLSDYPQINPGDEVVSINGILRAEIIDSLLTVSRADGKHGLNKQLNNIGISSNLSGSQKYALFDIYFPLFFAKKNACNNYEIVVKSFKSKKLTPYHIDLVSKDQRQQRYKDRFTAESKQPTGSFCWIASNCGYLKISNFTTKGWGKNYEIFLDSTFKELGDRKASTLIVDIRDNEGGDDGVRNKVISYLITQPVYYGIKRYFKFLKVPDDLMPYLETWDASFKKPKPASEYEKTNDNRYYKKKTTSIDSILPNQKHFSGTVYLLTNATNSSSSFFMADILQQSKSAKLVGEATGGTKQGINGGQFFFLLLPASDVEVDIPLIYQAPLKARKDEGIQPNINVTTQPSDLFNEVDAPLKYLKHRIEL